jgi:hypothetical protein
LLLLREENIMAKKITVVVAPPKSEPTTYTIEVEHISEVKAKASKLYYGRVYTGQYKYIKIKK